MQNKEVHKYPKIEMVPLPQNLHIPDKIPASEIRIPETYQKGSVQYEDDYEKPVNENEATHIRLTAKDNRSEILIGPVEPSGMIKLLVYFDEERRPISKDQASFSRELVLNEDYHRITPWKTNNK